MKIYLDTSNIEEIRDATLTGLIDGVTTNPSLIAKEGRDFNEVLNEIVSIMDTMGKDYTLSAEVTNTDSSDEMINQGRELSKINQHILVKVPLTKEGLKAVRVLSNEEIRCNVTLCFSSTQALLAAKAGAWCVSPFIGRLDDQGENGLHLIHEIREIFDRYKFETRILAASIRSVDHVSNCAKIGSDMITIPYKIFNQTYKHSLTDIGLEKFAKDWNDYKNKQ